MPPIRPSGEVRTLTYDLITGDVESITSDNPAIPGDEVALALTFNGPLLNTETWSGAGLASTTVRHTYNSDLRVGSIRVGAQTPIPFSYDADGILTAAGDLTLTPDPDNPRIAATSLGDGAGNAVVDSFGYNGFGELDTYTAQYDQGGVLSDLYVVDYSANDIPRDDLGRIDTVEEQVQGGAPVQRTYVYDNRGRLYQVKDDQGVVISEYTYDDNGNRTGGFTSSGSISATYDAQDRLQSYTCDA